MSEPLTDREFETLKALTLEPRVSFDNFKDAERLVDRLIATVDMWKKNYEDALNGQIVHDDYARLQEENAKLKARVERLLNGYEI